MKIAINLEEFYLDIGLSKALFLAGEIITKKH